MHTAVSSTDRTERTHPASVMSSCAHLATCDIGFEALLVEEVRALLPAHAASVRSVPGAVVFDAPSDAQAAVEALGCAHGVYAYLAHYEGVPKTHAGLESVRARLETLVRRFPV